MKHLEMSLKSPTSGKLLLHTNLTPHTRKQAQAAHWLEQMTQAAYNRALAGAGAADGGQIWDAFSVLSELKDLVGLRAFAAHTEWSALAVQVTERILAALPSTGSNSSEDQTGEAQPKLAPLQLLYGIYEIQFSAQATEQTTAKFSRIREELARCLFVLGETGFLEALLRSHRDFNTAPLWRLLVNTQISFGMKKEAAKSCARMALFAESNGMQELAAASREEAIGLDPNVKMDGTDFQTMTFMTKEELRLATREEIVGSFIRDPLHQDNYEHLIDFLEDEGAIVNAVRVVVAHTLTKNVPAQFQAATALPLRRLVTLVSHLQSKYIPQLQILSTEANNHRVQQGQEQLNPPDLQSLLLQAHREEEYRSITVNLLETIAKKISPPQGSFSQPVPIGSASSPQSQSSPSGSPNSPTSLSSFTNQQKQAQQRSSWGIKPAVGKDVRNKRFTMGLKTVSNSQVSSSPDSGFFGSRANVGSAADPMFGRGSGPRGSNFVPVENPIFSQPLDLPSRLHTPSVLTPFDAGAFQQQFGVPPPFMPPNGLIMPPRGVMPPNGFTPPQAVQQLSAVPQPQELKKEFLAADDSPFSSTVFESLPDELSGSQSGATSTPAPSESASLTMGTMSLSSSSVSVNSSIAASQDALHPLRTPSTLSTVDLDDPLAEVLALSQDLGRELGVHGEDDMPPPPPEDTDIAPTFEHHHSPAAPLAHSGSASSLPMPTTLLAPAQPLAAPQQQSSLPQATPLHAPSQPLQPFGAPAPMTSLFTLEQPSSPSPVLVPAAQLAINNPQVNRSPSPLTGMTLSGLLPPASMTLGGYGTNSSTLATPTLSNPALLGGTPLLNPAVNGGASALPPGARLSVQPGFTPYTPPTGSPTGSPGPNWSGTGLLPPSSPLINPAVGPNPGASPSNPGLMQPPAY